MKITSVDLYSNESEAFNLELSNAASNARYLVKSIVGLDADEIVPRFYGFGAVSGTKYHDLSLKKREIVFSIGLNPRYAQFESAGDIRDELYRAISSNRTGLVTLNFNSGTTIIATITGFITKFEAPLFGKSSDVKMTVECVNPLFRAVNAITYLPADISTGTPVVLGDGFSTAPHGFDAQLTVSAPFTSLLIRDNANSEWIFEVTPGTIGVNTGFIAGDVLYFSSEYTKKKLYIIRSTVTYHLLDKITPTSAWPMIFPGANTFYVSNTDKFAWNSISYYAAYWGV